MRVTHIEEGRNETTIFFFEDGSWHQIKDVQVEALGQHLAKEFGEPLLGLATTRKLLDELVTRLRVDGDPYHAQLAHHFQEIQASLPTNILDYRTVDS